MTMPIPCPPPIAHDKPWLAPLAGWSDLPFRLLCRELGAAVCCTEMISAKGLCYGGRNTEELLQTCPEDSPLVAQIFGSDAEFMGKAVSLLRERGFTYFDVNVGCSVPKVVKTGSGAAMLRDIPNLLKVAEAVVDAADGKAGFKLRLGYELGNSVCEHAACELQRLGAAWITLHPRFAKQGFSGVPDYSALARLSDSLRIPVIASGDLFTADDAFRVMAETGVSGVMYARGALKDPRIFMRHSAASHGGHTPSGAQPECTLTPKEERLQIGAVVRRHAELAKQWTPKTALLKMRTIIPRYVKGIEGASNLRKALITCDSYERFDSIMEGFFPESDG
ncbi:MAG: tRNA-dihydrouridine synthase family protein [Mailhella sp.]|nr:tRNA-dihydrouridine synthase family protein [Mailhella sp.]